MKLITQAKSQKNSPIPDIRICMFCFLYPPLFSGASYQAHSLAIGLAKQNHQVFVLAGRYPGTVAEETVDGIPVKRIPLINTTIPFISSLSMALSALPALFRHRRHFDILHIHSARPFDFIILFFAHLLGKKTILKMSLLGSPGDPATWSTSHLGFLMRPSFTLADRVISISESLSEHYIHSGLDPAKLRKMPQGVNIDRFRPVTEVEKKALREKLGLRSDARYLCFVGSFKYRKGADILVNTFIALAEHYPELNLLVVGPDAFDDPMRIKMPYAAFAEKLKNQLQQAGLAERVIFTGLVNNVEAYLQASDIFLFPSRREGFSTAVIEAMAVGLPCVLAEMDGVAAEVSANGKTAVVVTGEAPEQYAQQVSDLLSRPETAAHIGDLGHQRVVQEYARDIVTAKYVAIYTELLHHTPSVQPSLHPRV